MFGHDFWCRDQVRSELLSFYSNHYSSSTMKLAVVGKEGIDALCKMVSAHFGDIENRKLSAPKYGHDAFADLSRPILFKVVPVKDRRDLRLSWVMPSCYERTATRPTSLLSFCLGDECPGSILSFLKAEGLATSLSAGLCYNLPEFAMMRVTVSLTPSGLDAVNDVIATIFEVHCTLKMTACFLVETEIESDF